MGILFFLFEFFSDQLLAFMVLSVVWLCEVYSVVSVRTSVCIRFFPQVSGDGGGAREGRTVPETGTWAWVTILRLVVGSFPPVLPLGVRPLGWCGVVWGVVGLGSVFVFSLLLFRSPGQLWLLVQSLFFGNSGSDVACA